MPSADRPPSRTHLVLIPSYNTGPRALETVDEALRFWAPVWVVVDGSDDGSGEALARLAETRPHLRVLALPRNSGKGAAVLHGIRAAEAEGFTHVLAMDADGQHPAAALPEFMETSAAHPGALVLGLPRFDASAPALRVNGRRVSNFWANVETLWAGIGDSLFGFRVYPVAPLRHVLEETRWARRFDFDPEVAVRLCWRGLRPLNVPAPCRYLTAGEGGVSQFRYLRDNILLTWMHLRLMGGLILRLPVLLGRRLRRPPARPAPR